MFDGANAPTLLEHWGASLMYRSRHCRWQLKRPSSRKRSRGLRAPEGESDRENVGNWALKIGRLGRVRSGPKSALGQRVGARCLCMPGSRQDVDPAYLLILICRDGHPVMMTSRRL